MEAIVHVRVCDGRSYRQESFSAALDSETKMHTLATLRVYSGVCATSWRQQHTLAWWRNADDVLELW